MHGHMRADVPADFVFDFVLLFGTDRVFPIAQPDWSNLVRITPVLRAAKMTMRAGTHTGESRGD